MMRRKAFAEGSVTLMRQHPIVDTVIGALEDDHGRLRLSEVACRQIASALAAHFGKPDLADAVRALIVFAFFLDQRKQAPDAAAALIRVTQTAREAMAAQEIRIQDLVSTMDRDQEIRRFLGHNQGPAGTAASDAPSMSWLEAVLKRER